VVRALIALILLDPCYFYIWYLNRFDSLRLNFNKESCLRKERDFPRWLREAVTVFTAQDAKCQFLLNKKKKQFHYEDHTFNSTLSNIRWFLKESYEQHKYTLTSWVPKRVVHTISNHWAIHLNTRKTKRIKIVFPFCLFITLVLSLDQKFISSSSLSSHSFLSSFPSFLSHFLVILRTSKSVHHNSHDLSRGHPVVFKWDPMALRIIHCVHRHLSFYKYFGLMMACIGRN